MSKSISKKLVLFLSVIAIIFFALFGSSVLNVNDKEVTSWIESDLPIGSSKEKVISFCEKKGMEHSAFYKPELYYDKDHSISASIKKKWNYFLLVEGGVYVVFYFDGNNKLVRYKVDEAYTFL